MKNFRYYTPQFFQKIGYVVFYILHKFFVKLEIHGRENLIGLKKPLILATNHTNELDVTAISLIFPFFSSFRPIYFVSNPEEKYKTFGWRSYIYGGTFFNMLGAYNIHSGYHDYAISLEDHIALLKKGHTLWIAPEGKRTRDGKLNPARGGLGYLAYATGATVVPIAVDTFFNISPVDFFLRRRKVILRVGKAFSPYSLLPRADSAPTPTVEDFQKASQTVLNTIGDMME